MKRKVELKNLSCKCGRAYAHQRSLRRHAIFCSGIINLPDCQESLDISGSTMLKCKICNRLYKSKRAFKEHQSKDRCHAKEIGKADSLKSELGQVQEKIRTFQKAGVNERETAGPLLEGSPKHNDSNILRPAEEEKEGMTKKQNSREVQPHGRPDQLDFLSTEQLDSDKLDILFSLLLNREVATKFDIEAMEKRLTVKIDKILSAISRSKSMLDPLPPYMAEEKLTVLKGLPDVIQGSMREKVADFLCRQQHKKTRKNYERILLRFCSNLQGEPAYDDFKLFVEKQATVAAAKTVESDLSIIKSFLKGEFGWGDVGTKVNLSAFAPPKIWYAPPKQAVGEFIVACRQAEKSDFAVFVWFSYATGQRLADVLQARSDQLAKDDSGNTLIRIIASKTGKHTIKLLPGPLVKLLRKDGVFFNLGGKRSIQELFHSISNKRLPAIPIKAKNLRAGHISAVSEIIKSAMVAGSHSNPSTTEASYLNPAILDLFDMSAYYFS